MKKLKHTSGDWLVNGSAVKSHWPAKPVIICEANLISPIFTGDKKATHEEQKANLILISQAPKMLILVEWLAKNGYNYYSIPKDIIIHAENILKSIDNLNK
jgi:hypothetical protein